MAWMGLCKKDGCQNCMWRHFRFESMPVTIARREIRDFLFDFSMAHGTTFPSRPWCAFPVAQRLFTANWWAECTTASLAGAGFFAFLQKIHTWSCPDSIVRCWLWVWRGCGWTDRGRIGGRFERIHWRWRSRLVHWCGSRCIASSQPVPAPCCSAFGSAPAAHQQAPETRSSFDRIMCFQMVASADSAWSP